MKHSNTVALDKFYTKEAVAKQCILCIKNIDLYDFIIEPSAGDGKFSRNISKCIAFDIEPEHHSITKQDFLTLTKFKTQTKNSRLLFIGNPPFGIRNQLSKQFITHAISLGATTIAFILPNVFSKLANQKVFPKNWRLENVFKLQKDSFEVAEDEYHVPCSFYIWTRDSGKINLRKIKVEPTTDFMFLKRGDNSANFCINGNSGKVKSVCDVTNEKAEHYIKTKLPRTVFEALDYSFNSSVNGGVSWIGQQEILEAYYNYMESK